MPNFSDIKKIRPVQKSIPTEHKLKFLDTPKQMDDVVADESSNQEKEQCCFADESSNQEKEQLTKLVSSLITALESFIIEYEQRVY